MIALRMLRHVLLVVFFQLPMLTVCSGADVTPPHATHTSIPDDPNPTDSTVRSTDSAAVDESDARTELRLAAHVAAAGLAQDLESEDVIGVMSFHFSRFRRPTSTIGIAAEVGTFTLVHRSSAMIPIPYASLGPVFRFGRLALEGRTGLILIVPFASASAVYNLQLSRNLDLKLQTTGMLPLARPRPFLMIGFGIGAH